MPPSLCAFFLGILRSTSISTRHTNSVIINQKQRCLAIALPKSKIDNQYVVKRLYQLLRVLIHVEHGCADGRPRCSSRLSTRSPGMTAHDKRERVIHLFTFTEADIRQTRDERKSLTLLPPLTTRFTYNRTVTVKLSQLKSQLRYSLTHSTWSYVCQHPLPLWGHTPHHCSRWWLHTWPWSHGPKRFC